MGQYWYKGNRSRCIWYFFIFWVAIVWGAYGPLWGYAGPILVAIKEAAIAVDDIANFKARCALPFTITGLFLVWRLGAKYFLGRQAFRKPSVKVLGTGKKEDKAA